MQSEDQYLERTPDLVAKVRAMREAADKEMNKFTRVADYDVRRVVGQKPKVAPVSAETIAPSPVAEAVETSAKTRKPPKQRESDQLALEIPPAPAEPGVDGESQ